MAGNTGFTSHMTYDELICDDFNQEKRRIRMADKKRKVLTSGGNW